MKRQTIILILTLTSFLTAFGQGMKDNMKFSLNLPPLIGKTFDFKIETNSLQHFVPQVAVGLMIDNQLRGSWYKIDDYTENWNNSGAFLSLGLRYNTINNFEKATFFIGAKLISGYFDQTANTWVGDKIHRNGLFAAIGFESGFTFKITKSFYTDFGFQFSPQIYCDEQASSFFSVLPGIGAIGNLQGILSIKYSLNNNTRQAKTAGNKQ